MKSINLFWLALKWNNFDYKTIAELAFKVWYIVDVECSTKEVYDFLNTIKINTNATFYKTWQDVTSKTRFELFIDQILHYHSTYWTNFEWKIHIENEDYNKEVEVNFKEFKVIKSSTQEEILEKCDNILFSWIAIWQETLNDLFSIYDKFDYLPDIDKVKNKEAKMKICLHKNILPKENEEFIRFLIYISTWKTLLIKDRKTIKQIIDSGKDVSKEIEKFWLEKLSETFLRFKPLFLAFKQANSNNSKYINKLRKLAVKNHKAYKFSFFEKLLIDPSQEKIEKLKEKITELKNFKKIALLETIKRNLDENSKYSSYQVRNWKFFIKDNSKRKKLSEIQKAFYNSIYFIVERSLIKSIKEKYEGKTFFIPEYLDIKLPKSEKTFIWNFPMGTEIKLPKNDLVVWINWREKDWAEDFDLSYLDSQWNKIWWNSRYYDNWNKIIYSWDVTSAKPEATELMYFWKAVNWLVNINRYNWDENSLFTMFIAKESNEGQYKENYMVKKENILFQTKMISDKEEQILWIVNWNSFIFNKVILSDKIISDSNNVSTAYLEYVTENQKNILSLNEIFEKAWMIKKENIEEDEIDYDFTDVKKDDIISILA